MGRPRTPLVDIDTHPCKYVRPRDLSSYSTIPIRTIYHHIHKGALYAVKVGGVLLIPTQMARAYLNTPV